MIYSCDKMLDMIEANDKNLKVGDKIDFEVIGNIYDTPDLLEVGDV